MCFNARFHFHSDPILPNTNQETITETPNDVPITQPNTITTQNEVESRRFRSTSGVVREVRLIHRLQQEAIKRIQTLNCGNRNELGAFPRTPYNTRPFILYLPNGQEYSIRIQDPITNRANPLGSNTSNTLINPSNTERSSIFRVESVRGNTAIIRALKVVLDQYVATRSCATVDLNDFVGIQTLNDAYVANLYY